MVLPLELSADQVDHLFPFHLLVDGKLIIRSCGRVLRRLFRNDPLEGSALASRFRLSRPAKPLDHQTVAEVNNQLVILESLQMALPLKGQICELNSNDQFLFVGTPWLTDLESLQALGLRVNDFAQQDSLVDFLFLLQARNVALAESRQLNSILSKQRTELREAKRAAEAASSAKDTFLATMSHEIRTPMNAIMGMASLLQETRLDALQKEYVDIINNSTDSLLTLINDILDFSKIEAGSMELDKQAFDLGICLEEALDLMAGRATSKGLDMILDVDPRLPTAVIGDRTRLRQILWNLLSNAAKFTASGEIVVQLCGDNEARNEHQSTTSGRCYRINVRDTGIGIPEERLSRLFEPFQQGDPSVARQYGGTGLGLTITRRLCELMGGTIEVSSRPGVGSCFSVTLPLEADPEASDATLPQPLATGARLLLLMPGSTLRRVLHQQLEAMGLAVTVVAPGHPWHPERHRETDPDPWDVVVADAASLSPVSGEGDQGWQADRRIRQAAWLVVARRGDRIAPIPGAAGAPMETISRPVRLQQLRSALARLLRGEAASAGQEPTAAMEGCASEDPSAPRSSRILVVDDIAVNRRLAEQLLRKLGFAPELADSGEQAIRVVQEQPVDLIFMDVQMPGMDGQAATRAIRSLPDLPKQPWIVAMTAHARHEDREACLAAGMNDFLSKPVARADLAHAIDRCRSEPGWGDSLSGSSAPASAAPVPWQVIDASAWEELRTLLGDEEEAGLTELIDLFLEDAPRQVAAVTAAAESHEAEAMIRAVHSLRSPAASLGARRLASLCGSIEDALRSPSGSWPQDGIDGVILEAERACDALRQLRPSND